MEATRDVGAANGGRWVSLGATEGWTCGWRSPLVAKDVEPGSRNDHWVHSPALIYLSDHQSWFGGLENKAFSLHNGLRFHVFQHYSVRMWFLSVGNFDVHLSWIVCIFIKSLDSDEDHNPWEVTMGPQPSLGPSFCWYVIGYRFHHQSPWFQP